MLRVTTILLGVALAGGLESLAIAGGTACREPTVRQLMLELRAPDPRGRLEAVLALGEMGPAALQAAPALAEYIRSEPLRDDYKTHTDYGAIQAARESLVAMGPNVIPVLVEILGDPDTDAELAMVLAELGPPAVPALVEVLRSEDGRGFRHAAAADAVERMEVVAPGAVVGALVGALGQAGAKEAGVRMALVGAIGSLGPRARSAVPVLLESLADPDQYVEAYAAEALGKIAVADSHVVLALARTVSEGSEPAQAAAVRTLKTFGPAALPALTTLIEVLGSPHTHVVQTAVEAIAGMGAVARPAVPALQNLLHQAEASGRTQLADVARKALERLADAPGPGSPPVGQSRPGDGAKDDIRQISSSRASKRETIGRAEGPGVAGTASHSYMQMMNLHEVWKGFGAFRQLLAE